MSVLTKAHFHQRFDLGETHLTATLFGQPRNWSLLQLDDPEYTAQLEQVFMGLRVGRALAPLPTQFTSHIIEAKNLTTAIPVGNLKLYRNLHEPADGVPLCGGDGFIISSSSCPTTIMSSGPNVLALHTGRDCLIDRGELLSGKRTEGRTHRSIIEAAVDYLGNPTNILVKVLWGVPGCFFEHKLICEKYGPVNREMYRKIKCLWGDDATPRRGDTFRLDVPKLVRAQCIAQGVPAEQVDLTHGYQPYNGTWTEGRKGTGRNLVVVARHS